MTIKRLSALSLLVLLTAWTVMRFSGSLAGLTGSAADVSDAIAVGREDSSGVAPARSYLSSYIVDKDKRIALKNTSVGDAAGMDEQPPKDEPAAQLVNRDTADYFRYLQTHFSAGATLQANTEAIRQHLMETLPKEDAEKLFALYEKFVDFEFSVGEKTKDWKMPDNPTETLALIAKMQKLQQQTFGVQDADLLFGGELKTLEYTARRSGILNDRVAGGAEKEVLLKKLATDMFGPEGEKVDAKKNPYNLFEEKLLVYKNDLDKLDAAGQEKLINELRAKYLPPVDR